MKSEIDNGSVRKLSHKKLNKTFLLYILGLVAVILAIIVPALSWLSPFTYVVIFPLMAIWLWKREGRSLWDVGYRFSEGWFRKLVLGLIFGFLIPAFFQGIQILGGWITLARRADFPMTFASYFVVLLLKMIFLVAIEEFVFRGFFLQALSRQTGVLAAIVLASLLWGIGHLTSMVQDGLAPGLMLFGMITFLLWGTTLSLCYLQADKSLWLPFGLHLGINLSFSLIGWFFIGQPHAPQWWIGNPSWSPESGLMGVLVWSIFALVVYWFANNKMRFRKS